MAGREIVNGGGKSGLARWKSGIAGRKAVNGGARIREWRGAKILNDVGETANGARMADGGA